MTGKERIYNTLAGKKVDKIPIALICDSDYQCKAAGVNMCEFNLGNNNARAEIQQKFIERHKKNDFLLCWEGVNPKRGDLIKKDNYYLYTNVNNGKIEKIIPSPQKKAFSDCSVKCETPITCEEEIDKVLGNIPTYEQIIKSGEFEPLSILHKEIGGKTFIASMINGGFPESVYYLGGFEKAMETVALDPNLVVAVMDKLNSKKIEKMKVAKDAGTDAVWHTAYYEGAEFLSPKTWYALMYSQYEKLIKVSKELDLKFFLWFLGDCIPLLPYLKKLKIDALIVEEPRCGYSSDVEEIRKSIGNKITIFGWSPEMAMIKNDKDKITEKIKKQMQSEVTKDPFIMGTTFVTSEVSCHTIDYYCNEIDKECGFRVARTKQGNK